MGRGKMDDQIIEERLVDNPLTGFAQWRAEISEHGAAYAGKIQVSVNAVSLVGGFVRFNGTQAENAACARYKGLWEASQVGGARAVDPGREPVDGGWLNPEAVFEIGADARKVYSALTQHLGRMDTNRLHFVVVGEWGPTPYAKHFYRLRVPNSQAVSRAKVEVRRIAARAAAFLKLTGEGPINASMRSEGELPDAYTGEVSTRKVA